MRLPQDPRRRREAVIEVVRQCASDREERRAYHQELRAWYLRGTPTQSRARYNKLRAHVRQSSAYLYQSESVRFGLVLPPEYGDQFSAELETARDELHRTWHDSRAGLEVGLGVEWGHVYPTVVWKVIPVHGHAMVSLVPDPADVGVLEPDRRFDRQEAIVHFFWLTLPQIRRLVEGHPQEKELIGLAESHAVMGGGGDEPLIPTLERVIMTSTSPNLIGNITPPMLSPAGRPETPRVECFELWVVDDRLQDWRIITGLAPSGQVGQVLWDRRSRLLGGSDPFVALTLGQDPAYLWGMSEVDSLSGLQEWRERRMDQIDRMMELQLDPPIVLGGFGGLSDERAKRLRTPGGTLATSIPNPSVNRIAPVMPPEAFGEVDAIDKMFADQGGLPILLQGQGEPGIRAGNQVGVLATLASARIREHAMRVEYATSEIATLVMRLHRELHEAPLQMPDGKHFLLSQLPREIVALVAAHSASPLYAAAIKQDALEMLKVGAIDKPTYVELKDPPMVDVLRAKARRLEEAAAKRAERILALQEEKARRGPVRSR